MQTRLGNPNDFQETHRILKEVALRLKKQKSSQWSHILKNEEADVLSTHLKNEEVLIFEKDHKLIGLAYLYQMPNTWDKSLWQTDFTEGIYYLHKVAIADNFTSQNIGSKMLEATINWVKNEKGKSIRLDCMANINYLNQFYLESGFVFKEKRGKADGLNLPADFNLYEYIIASE